MNNIINIEFLVIYIFVIVILILIIKNNFLFLGINYYTIIKILEKKKKNNNKICLPL